MLRAFFAEIQAAAKQALDLIRRNRCAQLALAIALALFFIL